MHGDTGIPRYQDSLKVQGLASELGRFRRKHMILVDTILIHGDNRWYAWYTQKFSSTNIKIILDTVDAWWYRDTKTAWLSLHKIIWWGTISLFLMLYPTLDIDSILQCNVVCLDNPWYNRLIWICWGGLEPYSRLNLIYLQLEIRTLLMSNNYYVYNL